MLTLTQADNGRSLALQVGGTFTVSLDENPTTGFQWAIDSSGGDLVKLQASEYVPAASAGVGRGGRRILTFKAQRAGDGQLKLELRREWQNSIAERFTVTLQIRE
jgi:inhibitor of cysteine peptidase